MDNNIVMQCVISMSLTHRKILCKNGKNVIAQYIIQTTTSIVPLGYNVHMDILYVSAE